MVSATVEAAFLLPGTRSIINTLQQTLVLLLEEVVGSGEGRTQSLLGAGRQLG